MDVDYQDSATHLHLTWKKDQKVDYNFTYSKRSEIMWQRTAQFGISLQKYSLKSNSGRIVTLLKLPVVYVSWLVCMGLLGTPFNGSVHWRRHDQFERVDCKRICQISWGAGLIQSGSQNCRQHTRVSLELQEKKETGQFTPTGNCPPSYGFGTCKILAKKLPKLDYQ